MLETLDVRERVRRVLEQVNRQNEVIRVKEEISEMVEEEMSSSQREYLLRQQLKSIRRELGETDVDEDDIENLRERIALARLPSHWVRASRSRTPTEPRIVTQARTRNGTSTARWGWSWPRAAAGSSTRAPASPR